MKKTVSRALLAWVAIFMMLPFLPLSGVQAAGFTLGTTVPARNQVMWAVGYWQGPAPVAFSPWSGSPAYGVSFMYEPLFGYDWVHNVLIPVLGTSYNWTSDGSNCTVKLNPDAKWSDGSQVTADDVVYSYQLAEYSTSTFGGLMQAQIASITATDNLTVVFSMVSGYYHSGFLDAWLTTNVPIVPKEVWVPMLAQSPTWVGAPMLDNFPYNDWFNSTMNASWEVCSGPYVPYYRSADQSQEVYKLRSDWWGNGKIYTDLPNTKGVPQVPYIGEYHFASNTLQDEAFVTGQVDLYSGYYADIWNIQAVNPNVNTWFGNQPPYMQGTSSMVELIPNHTIYPMNETWFREMLAYDIDYDTRAATDSSGYLLRAKQGFIDNASPTMTNIYNDTIQKAYGINYNVTEAVEILKNHCTFNTTTNLWQTAANQSVPGVSLGPYKIKNIQGWTDTTAHTDGWCATFTHDLNISFIDDTVDFTTYISQMGAGQYQLAMACTGPKLLNNPIIFLAGYTGTHQWNVNVSYWNDSYASDFNAQFKTFQTSVPGSAAYNMSAWQMQYDFAVDIPSIPCWPNGFWYAYANSTWTGFSSAANQYNQITTSWDVTNWAVKTRLILNLVAAPAAPTNWALILGIAAVVAIIALVIAVVVLYRKRPLEVHK